MIGAGHWGMVHIFKCLKQIQEQEHQALSYQSPIRLQLVHIVEPVLELREALLSKLSQSFQAQIQAIPRGHSVDLPSLSISLEVLSDMSDLPEVSIQENHRQAAIICTSIPELYPCAFQLLTKGYHCFIEKPMVQNRLQAARLIELALQKKLLIYAGWIERWNPIFKEAILQQQIEIQRAVPWNRKHQAFHIEMDLLCHDLDLLLQKHQVFQERRQRFRDYCQKHCEIEALNQGVTQEQAQVLVMDEQMTHSLGYTFIEQLLNRQTQCLIDDFSLSYLCYEEDEVILLIQAQTHRFKVKATRKCTEKNIYWHLINHNQIEKTLLPQQHAMDLLQMEYLHFFKKLTSTNPMPIYEYLELFAYLSFVKA
jgi:hypothetical protein